MPLIIGVTGGLSTGKSTVASMFARLGAKVLDADRVAHQHLRRRGVCFKPVVRLFGDAILTRGRIDRKKLAEIVFSDLNKLNQLVRVVHPAVKKTLKEKIQQVQKSKKFSVIVMDVPLLFESGLNREVDFSVVVKASRARQTARAMENLKITQPQVSRRIKAQMPLREKIRLADIIIDNEGTTQQTKKQVRTIWQKLLLQKK